MNWYLKVLQNYANFDGRASRSEYWYFTLVHAIIIFVFVFMDIFLGSFNHEAGIGAFSGIYLLALFLPSLAVMIRRLHDIGRSGWFCLFGLIPIAGPFILLIFNVQDSDFDSNKYGSNPKEVGNLHSQAS